jgi:hypothetical protein
MPIIRVAREAVDLKVLVVPATCPMRRPGEDNHGHARTTPQVSRTWLHAGKPGRGGCLTEEVILPKPHRQPLALSIFM